MFEVRSASIFAKILSKSKVSLSVDKNIKTAMIDLKNSIIHIPDWDLKEELLKFLISHECSHAILTPVDEWLNIFSSKPSNLKKYIYNLVEDCRVDKLMLEMYPGLRKTYIVGIKELIDTYKFFDLSPEKLKDMNFLNRMNVDSKANTLGQLGIDIVFGSDESIDYEKVKKCRTFYDVIEVSEYLYTKYKNDQSATEEFLNVDFYSAINDKDSKESTDEIADVESMVVFVDTQAESSSNESAFPSSTNKNSTFIIPHLNNYIVDCPYKSSGSIPSIYDNYINYMVQQFNLYKNAIKLSTTRKVDVGDLDALTLHTFKYNEKIFKQKLISQNQQNHGLIILLDTSSSMDAIFDAAKTQVVYALLFAKKMGIKFQAYAFTSNTTKIQENISQSRSKWGVFDIGNDRDSKLKIIDKMKFRSNGSTPLCSSLIAITDVLKKFKAENFVDVVNLMVITDGGCDSLGLQYSAYSYENILVKTEERDSQAAFYKIFKDLFNVNTITIDISGNSEYNVTNKDYCISYTVPVKMVTDLDSETKVFLQTLIKNIA